MLHVHAVALNGTLNAQYNIVTVVYSHIELGRFRALKSCKHLVPIIHHIF